MDQPEPQLEPSFPSDPKPGTGASDIPRSQTTQPGQVADHTEAERKQEIGINWAAWIHALSGIAIVIITFFYTYYAREQALQMRDAIDAARRSAEAGTNAAQTAKDALTFTREVIEGPYVGADSIAVENFPGLSPTFILTFHNFGRSPAVNMTGNATMGLRPGEIESELNFDPSGNFALPPIPGAASRRRWFSPASPLNPDILERLRSGRTRFYIFGFIQYEDTSGRKIPRREFCMVCNPEQSRPSNTLGPFDACTEHNK